MVEYITAEKPSMFWVTETLYFCKQCNTEYMSLMPAGNELVKFVEINGCEERWLPTYTKGGYLDLLEALIHGFKRNDEITVRVGKEFEQKFSIYQKPSPNDNKYTTLFANKFVTYIYLFSISKEESSYYIIIVYSFTIA